MLCSLVKRIDVTKLYFDHDLQPKCFAGTLRKTVKLLRGFFLPIQIWIDFASYLIKFYHMIFEPKMYLQKMALGNNNLQ